MKHKELHWDTASEKQKIGYLMSALGMTPDPMMSLFGKRFSMEIMVSEEAVMRVPFKQNADILRYRILKMREDFLRECDGMLATIAEIQALE